MTVQAEHTVPHYAMDHQWGCELFEVPRYGAVLSPAEEEAVQAALSVAAALIEVSAQEAEVKGHRRSASLRWEIAAELALARAVMRAATKRTWSHVASEGGGLHD